LSKDLSRRATLLSRARAAARTLTESYEPDLSSEDGAVDFLRRLKSVTAPPESELTFNAILKLRGHRYYAFYTGLVTITLVLVIFPMLAYLPLSGRDTRWVLLSAVSTVLTVWLLLLLYAVLLGFHAWLVGSGLNKEPSEGGREASTEGVETGDQGPTDVTLRKCALELKYLIDTLNDRTGTLNHMLAYVVPALLFLYVLPLLLPGSDPAADNTPVSVLTFAITLLYGMVAALLVAPIRFAAHKRLTKYRVWLRSVERLLISRADV
jgi:hypothetical protein